MPIVTSSSVCEQGEESTTPTAREKGGIGRGNLGGRMFVLNEKTEGRNVEGSGGDRCRKADASELAEFTY